MRIPEALVGIHTALFAQLLSHQCLNVDKKFEVIFPVPPVEMEARSLFIRHAYLGSPYLINS